MVGHFFNLILLYKQISFILLC